MKINQYLSFNRTIKSVENRESNFELLRIFLMLGIIFHHIIVNNMNLNIMDTPTKYVALLFAPLGKIFYVAFICLTMWFIVDSNFRSKKIISLYLETFFYFVLLYFAELLINKNKFEINDFLSYFFVISGGRSNFISAYIPFLLFVPILVIIKDKLNKQQNLYVIIILGFTQFILQIIGCFVNSTWAVTHIPSIILAYLFYYFVILFIKKYPIKVFTKKQFLSFVFIVTFLISYISRIINANLIIVNNNFKNFLNSLCSMEYSLINALGGICVLLLFNFEMKKKYLFINVAASPTLGILLIHEHMSFRNIIFQNIIKINQYTNSPSRVFLATIIFGVMIYIICGIVDLFRKNYLEYPLISRKCLKNLFKKIDNLLNSAIDSNLKEL